MGDFLPLYAPNPSCEFSDKKLSDHRTYLEIQSCLANEYAIVCFWMRALSFLDCLLKTLPNNM